MNSSRSLQDLALPSRNHRESTPKLSEVGSSLAGLAFRIRTWWVISMKTLGLTLLLLGALVLLGFAFQPLMAEIMRLPMAVKAGLSLALSGLLIIIVVAIRDKISGGGE